MQKHIQRAINTLLVILCVNSISNAAPQPINREDFKIPSQSDVPLDKDLLKNLDAMAKQSVLKYGQFNEHNMSKVFSSAMKQEEVKKEETFFYMFSKSVPLVSLTNLFPQMHRLKEIKPNAKIIVVLNGFPNLEFWKLLRTVHKDEHRDLFKVRIDPRIFKAYELKQVPAWIKTACPVNFEFKKCDTETSFLAKGDMSIVDFYDLLSKQDKQYLPTYHQLIKAK